MLSPDVIAAITVPAILNWGAALFYAGRMDRTLMEHDKRLDQVEKSDAEKERRVSNIEGRLGI